MRNTGFEHNVFKTIKVLLGRKCPGPQTYARNITRSWLEMRARSCFYTNPEKARRPRGRGRIDEGTEGIKSAEGTRRPRGVLAGTHFEIQNGFPRCLPPTPIGGGKDGVFPLFS